MKCNRCGETDQKYLNVEGHIHHKSGNCLDKRRCKRKQRKK